MGAGSDDSLDSENPAGQAATLVKGYLDDTYDFGFYYSPTAVRLLSFKATGTGSSIVLSWETATEIDNLGFNYQ